MQTKEPNEPYNWAESPWIYDKIYCGDSRSMDKVPSNSVALVVTSPPYCLHKEYEINLTFNDWLKLMYEVFKECYRVLEPGGRIAINVANTGRKPYTPLTAYVYTILDELDYLLRGEIIWHKGNLQNNSCAWGSWRKATNPSLRDEHEYIIVASKQQYARKRRGESDITREEFLDFTKSIWNFVPESAKRIGHPAPFPIELPRRLIKLLTFKNDVVLDPMAGSCTTAIAALETGRHFICYDLQEKYCQLGANRIEKWKLK